MRKNTRAYRLKSVLVSLVLLSSIFLSSCLAGSADWIYSDLPGGYELCRLNVLSIIITKPNPVGSDTVVDDYVSYIAWDSDVIFAQREHAPRRRPESVSTYYVIEVNTGTVHSKLSEEEFFELAAQWGYTPDTIEWVRTTTLKPK